MILIAHRGNTKGPNKNLENTVSHIESAISDGYDVEIDIWGLGNYLYLGHDEANTKVDNSWLELHSGSLWIHCKNVTALSIMTGLSYNYFFHHTDAYTITSKGYVWAYPGNPPAGQSTIAVMPELFTGKRQINLHKYAGVCSDFVGIMGFTDNES
jgi:hypothetical protein